MFSTIIQYLQSLMYSLGYFGIFILMVIESSFIPFPSEVIIIPAGYLASKGELNLFLIIIIGVLGSIIGALINYYIGKFLGRNYILKKKKLLFINTNHLIKSENFFKKYGGITTFIGRLIPAVRQYISLPAGFSNMNLLKFIGWTALGAGFWVTFLALLGYFIGEGVSKSILTSYNFMLFIVLGVGILISIIIYFRKKGRKQKKI